jgi:hypothetical protein
VDIRGARAVRLVVAAAMAAGVGPGLARRAWGFELVGHEIIEAAAYTRLLGRNQIPGTGVSGRVLLATLISEGVLVRPPCFDVTHPSGRCGPQERLAQPLRYWPLVRSGALDLLINRQLNEKGQCQHFMARTSDALSPVDPQRGVAQALGTDAYRRCVELAGVVFDLIVRDPRHANWRAAGAYALIHAIEDSFSAAHAERDQRWNIVHLLSWTLIDWPSYFWAGRFSFPPATHHAISDARDLEYLRPGARTNDGRPCEEPSNPYAVPESCLSVRTRLAVSAVEDLLIAIYRVRASARAEGRPATLATPAAMAIWSDYLHAYLPSAEVAVELPTASAEAPGRPDVFVGVQGTARHGGWGVGLWGARLFVGPAVPFLLGVIASGSLLRTDGVNQLSAGAGVSLLLPLVDRFAIGAAPASGVVTCDTRFTACTTDVGATVGSLLVPLGEWFWMGLEGPRWSWTDRAFRGSWLGVTLGWAHEKWPVEAEVPPDVLRAWNPPRPDEVLAFRRSRWTGLVFAAATAASSADNQFFGGGLAWRLDRDRWNRRSGLAAGLALEVDHGVIDGRTNAGALALAPAVAVYLVPERVVVSVVPALVRIGTVTGHGFGADVAGRAGIAFDVGRVEVSVDSPPLSYLSPGQWHALPITVRLGLMFD